MSEPNTFSRGDVVIHPRRPEWGEGVIDRVVPATHEGKPAQRLDVKFVHQGLVTINTGVAPLVRKEAYTVMATTTTTPNTSPLPTTGTGRSGWLDSLGGKAETPELARLPDAMIDPFASVERRLTAAMDAYRFNTEPRSIIEWGVAQTGLNDPLSKYTRHDLEHAFPRYARDRDNTLLELVKLIKKQGKAALLQQAMQTTRYSAARVALQKAMRG